MKMTHLHVCSERGNEVETENLPGDGLMSCPDHPQALVESLGTEGSETKMTNIYDDSLNNDACHEHVLDARNAGRAWADREYEAASNESGSNLAGSDWSASDNDASELVSFGPTSDVVDQFEREEELREICKSAARERWNQLTAE